jgi:hypothetical protein
MPRTPTQKKDRVVLTGMTQDELRTVRRRAEAGVARCYLCKRRDGDTSLAMRVAGGSGAKTVEPIDDNLVRIVPLGERTQFVEAQLRVTWVKVHDDASTEYVVPLCNECAMLIGRRLGR